MGIISYEKEADLENHVYIMHWDSMKGSNYKFHKTHIHQSIELIVCESGNLSYMISNCVGEIKANQVLIINPYDTHFYKYNKDFKGYILVLSRNYTNDILEIDKNEFNNVITIKHKEDWKSFLDKLNYLFLNYEKMSFLGKKGEFLLLFDILSRYDLVRKKNTRNSKDLSGQIFEYIEQNYMRKITLESMAKVFCYSKTYFCSLFKEISEDGMTFNDYLNHFRARKVLEMKNDVAYKGVPLKVLIKNAGFSSPQTFYRVIKKISK